MAVTVYVPTPYRGPTSGEARVSVAGRDVVEVVAALEAGYPGFRERICDDGQLKHYVSVYVNGEAVQALQALRTPLKDGDEVAIVPALAGGSKRVLLGQARGRMMEERFDLDEHADGKVPLKPDGREPEDVIRWALESFPPERVAVCTSFQVDGMAILDMAWRINPRLRVFTVDTGRLPQETYDLMDRVRERYGLEVEVYWPDPQQVEPMLREHGVNLFHRAPSLRALCCEVRKVEPLRRALAGLDCWITGLRRDQAATRANVRKIELDHLHGGLVKVNPLADWTEEAVWEYVRANDVPCHRLYDLGYKSIGCLPCTRPVGPGEDARAGRWWWEKDAPKECGMHCAR